MRFGLVWRVVDKDRAKIQANVEKALNEAKAELQKGPMTVESVTNIGPVCKIDNETMKNNKCWDNNCPKGKDAN